MAHRIMGEAVLAAAMAGAGVAVSGASAEAAEAHGTYVIECRGPDGGVKWTETIDNLVTTPGKNDALDKYLAGSAYTAAWYIGLISSASYTTGPAAADTAGSHGGWTESTAYSNGARPTAAFAAASGGSKSLSSAASFSINAADTIKGCFLISNSTKGGTTGTLYSAGLFSGGDKVVGNGDTLNVSYTASL